jgi:arsenate reductase
VKVAFLYNEGCQGSSETLSLLKDVLMLMAPGTVVEEVRIDGPESLPAPGFLGSPAIRIDGMDIEGRSELEAGSGCRLHNGGGVPPRWLVEAAVLRAMKPRHVLFLCVANSARSQMAEGIARSLAPAGVALSSAGSSPTAVRPEAVAVLGEIGIDISGHRSKGFESIAMDGVDAVIALCADEICPYLPRPVLQIHWALPDPAAAAGQEERMQAFRQVRDELHRRMSALFTGWPT